MGGRGQMSGVDKHEPRFNKQTHTTSNIDQFDIKKGESFDSAAKRFAKAGYFGDMPAKDISLALLDVNDFTEDGYSGIRAAQHENKRGKRLKQAHRIETLVDKGAKWDGGVTYRGIAVDERFAKSINIGDEIHDQALTSWSTKEDIGRKFANLRTTKGEVPVLLRTTSKAQKHGVPVRLISAHSDEFEVLVSSKARYRVSRIIQERNGVRIIDLQEI